MRALLEADADVEGDPPNEADAITMLTKSPLVYAASRGHESIARVLLQFGADPNSPKSYVCHLHSHVHNHVHFHMHSHMCVCT